MPPIQVRLERAHLVLISSDRPEVLPYGSAVLEQTPAGLVVTEKASAEDARPTCGLDVPTAAELDIQIESGGLTVRHFQGTLRARLREGTARIEDSSGRFRVVTGYGSVTVEHVRGTVDVLTTSGNVSVRRLQGELQAISDTGKLHFEDVDGPIVARSTTGSITGNELNRTARLSTRTGAINVNSTSGQLTMRTQSGDLSLETSVVAHTTLETQKGRVEVHLGPETDARIEAAARRGVVRTERVPLSPGSSRRVVRSRFREGRARLQVTTGLGVIEIAGPTSRHEALVR